MVILHKHKYSHPYHKHGRANILRRAVRGIKNHDKWQMKGRKKLDLVNVCRILYNIRNYAMKEAMIWPEQKRF